MALVSMTFTNTTPIPDPSTSIDRFIVVIPKGASDSESGKTFTPQEAVISSGTTVRWVNRDVVTAIIAADNDNDPEFYNATKDFVLISPGDGYEFTFTKPGTYGYHGKPSQQGTIVVIERFT